MPVLYTTKNKTPSRSRELGTRWRYNLQANITGLWRKNFERIYQLIGFTILKIGVAFFRRVNSVINPDWFYNHCFGASNIG